MKEEHKLFYQDILKALQNNTLAVFGGAGLSKQAGHVNWKELLKDITEDLGLRFDLESDLIAVAQYNVNKVGSRSMLNAKIIDEFNKDVDITENHKILARLPIQTYWTTNYDDLIERSILDAKRIPDVKHSIRQLNDMKPRRDAVVYKMHGDMSIPDDAVITKDDYERYFTDKFPFVSALTSDLSSKLFMFIGFSFNDPNLDYVLSRVRIYLKGTNRHHFHFVKKVQMSDPDIVDRPDYEYKLRKQELFVQDLKRFGLQPVYVDRYPEITEILKEVEGYFKKKTVFVSGSANSYGTWSPLEAQKLVHSISKALVKEGYRIVNGFGWGVGSAVINGALEAIYERPNKYSEGQLVIRPFPQFETGGRKLADLWEDYRQRMISFSGIALFIFGNKVDDNGSTVMANGVYREFQISVEQGVIPIPVATTGYMAEKIFNEISGHMDKLYGNPEVGKLVKELAKPNQSIDEIVASVIKIVQTLNK